MKLVKGVQKETNLGTGNVSHVQTSPHMIHFQSCLSICFYVILPCWWYSYTADLFSKGPIYNHLFKKCNTSPDPRANFTFILMTRYLEKYQTKKYYIGNYFHRSYLHSRSHRYTWPFSVHIYHQCIETGFLDIYLL